MHRNRRLLYVRHLSVTAQPVLLLTLTNSRMLLIMAWQMGATPSPSTTSTSPCAPLSPTSTRFYYVIGYHILAQYDQEKLCRKEIWWYIKFRAMVKSTENPRILGPNFKGQQIIMTWKVTSLQQTGHITRLEGHLDTAGLDLGLHKKLIGLFICPWFGVFITLIIIFHNPADKNN